MMQLPEKLPDLPAWAWAGIGFGAVWLLLRPKDAATAGQAIGNALASAADGLIAGTVKGTAGIFGIPDTDEALCAAALAANDGTAAGKYCPAGTLIKAIPQSFSDWLAGLAHKPVAPSGHGGFTGPTVSSKPTITAPSILNGGSFETQSNCLLLGVDCSVTGEKQFDLGTWIDSMNGSRAVPVAGLRG